MDLNHVRRFAVTRDGLFSALWVWCSCWIVLNLDTFLVGWETISMVNKAIYSIPIFSPQAAPLAGPLIMRGGAFGTRAASVLAALAAVRLVGGERLRLAQQSDSLRSPWFGFAEYLPKIIDNHLF